jgi:hypothetical protein
MQQHRKLFPAILGHCEPSFFTECLRKSVDFPELLNDVNDSHTHMDEFIVHLLSQNDLFVSLVSSKLMQEGVQFMSTA